MTVCAIRLEVDDDCREYFELNPTEDSFNTVSGEAWVGRGGQVSDLKF